MQRLSVGHRRRNNPCTSWLGKLAKGNSLLLKLAHTARSASEERQAGQPGSRYNPGRDREPWPLNQVSMTDKPMYPRLS